MSNNEQWLVECISEENLKNIKKQAYKYNLCNKDIAIFGAGISGMQTCRVLSSMSGFNKKIVFTDNAVDKWNTSICGFPVIKPEEAVERHFYFVISMTSYEEVEAQLHQYGLHKEIDYCVLGNSAENKLLRNIVGVEKNNVILGDCVLETVSMCENEQFSIEHYLMSENTEVLSLDGIYMRTYYYLIEQVLYQNPMTKNIIIVLSVDTFSNKYNFLPKAQHSDIMHKINSLVNNTNADINEYLQILEDREKAKGIIDASSPIRSNKVNIDLSKRNNLVLNLLYKLRKEQEST